VLWFDPTYFIYVLPALLLATWAQGKVAGAYRKYSQIRVSSGQTGASVARQLLSDAGADQVTVEMNRGRGLSDHYDPRQKAVRLSAGVYNGSSLAALGIAAHEVGHALQDRTDYLWLGVRNNIIPVTRFGSSLAVPLFIVGLIIAGSWGGFLMNLGIIFFAGAVLFQLVTLPVEYNASTRALQVLEGGGYIQPEERSGVRQVLDAAALTYLAAALMAVMNLMYLLALRGRRR